MNANIWVALDASGEIISGGHNRTRVYFSTKENAIKWATKDDRTRTIIEFNIGEIIWTK